MLDISKYRQKERAHMEMLEFKEEWLEASELPLLEDLDAADDAEEM